MNATCSGMLPCLAIRSSHRSHVLIDGHPHHQPDSALIQKYYAQDASPASLVTVACDCNVQPGLRLQCAARLRLQRPGPSGQCKALHCATATHGQRVLIRDGAASRRDRGWMGLTVHQLEKVQQAWLTEREMLLDGWARDRKELQCLRRMLELERDAYTVTANAAHRGLSC